MTTCRVCGSATREAVVAAERMHGLGGAFAYDACDACGAVQLRAVPADMRPFYPATYYAHSATKSGRGRAWAVRALRDRLLYRGPLLARWAVSLLAPTPRRLSRRWFSVTGAGRDARILDVGCGRGQRLAELADAGFRHLLGVDPYLREEAAYRGGAARVRRGTIHDVEGAGTWDLVMFHHALEHIEDQVGTMRRAAALLRPGGWALVRVPIVSSWAWEHYGADWVQLDAPRHLVLHSVESLRRLGAECGLTVELVDHDSTEFQFAGSEGYRLGLTLAEALEAFPAATVREWRRRAYRLNREQRGDQAAFYFRKPGGVGVGVGGAGGGGSGGSGGGDRS